ncbi:MAG: hypothetical protein BWK76_24045 [Desulfobulbaceae bacterium A2]|nr:MAG: hypothetical protein BWK76_24045 [Desulfobulbaceae bacterium A2]
MKKRFAGWLFGLVVFGCAWHSHSAPLQNAGFEAGDFGGWSVSTDGNSTAEVVQLDNGYLPPEGQYFAKLSSGDYSYDGSSIRQALEWSTGDLLVFTWNFYSTDTFNDFAGFTLDVPTHLVDKITLASGMQATGWHTYTYVFDENGTGAISFWAHNGGDQMFSSYLYLDSITYKVTSGPGGDPVPEPCTMLLMGTGIAGVVAVRRKRSFFRSTI